MHVEKQYSEKMGKEDDSWLDTQFSQCDESNPSHISMLFGREFLTIKIYQLCPPEVINLLRITFIGRAIVLCQIVSYPYLDSDTMQIMLNFIIIIIITTHMSELINCRRRTFFLYHITLFIQFVYVLC